MEIVNVTYAGEGKVEQDYSFKDKSLIQTNYINTQFGDSNDRIEFYIYDLNDTLIDATYDFKDYTPYQIINPETNKFDRLLVDPIMDAKNNGFNRGSFKVQYNFLKNLFNSSDRSRYWIKEISPTRTEIKLSSQIINDQAIQSGYNQFKAYTAIKNYYSDFYLNFGNNEQIIAINSTVTSDDSGTYLLIKLYEPLPFDYDIKTQLWIVDKIAESVSYNVDIEIEANITETNNSLRGPNFNVRINEKNTQTTPYYSYASLIASPITSSYRQLASYYQDKAININIDYTNFENFIHFSSATERLNNFVYKLSLIESYNSQIIGQSNVIGSGNQTTISSSITTLQSSISNIVENFDTYEYYLYYASESFAWPKRNSTKPYILYSVTSSNASNWLGSKTTVPSQYTSSLLYSSSLYDDTNKDLLRGSIPQYILDDSNNTPYITFVDMIGQHFDNIWVYYKDVSNRYNATNDPFTGISLDMVSDALKGMGMELYTNTSITNNVYYDLFGYNEDGTLLPPTGSELIKTYVTSSLPTGSMGSKQIQQEIYKRIYHNLPYLLKTRGTQRGIKALISIYGISDNILTVNEFGGANRYTTDGVIEINNNKITTVTSSLLLSSSLLSPFTTLQYYENDNRLNSTNIEVGFSISDILNSNITSSLGYFSIDNLIGNPNDQYSSSYAPLVSASNSYFSTYTQPHSVWEYIRLIKYFNNSLFKTIKDFVPARANISTGIIVKSHMLERNKYARHEPSMSIDQTSQSIDMLTLSGEPGNIFSGSNTNWSYDQVSPLGYIPVSSSQNIEKLTGEFGGTEIIVTNGDALSQAENSNNSTLGLISVTPSALFQNVTGSVRSQKFFDLDYTSNQLTPINLGLITQSINDSVNNNYNTYTNPNNPYAELQDYNYATRHFTDPRYYGSKVESKMYNTYTLGDNSYGKTAAIDKKTPYFAYLVDIYTASLNLQGRVNSQIKYIIDGNQNILDLTKANINIFSTQNIFKSGQGAIVSLFDYDPRNPDVQFLTNKSTIQIYEGGFRYSPILFNIDSSSRLSYNIATPYSIQTEVTTPGGTVISEPSAPFKIAQWTYIVNRAYVSGYGNYISAVTMSCTTSPTTEELNFTIEAIPTSVGIANGYSTQTLTISMPNGTVASAGSPYLRSPLLAGATSNPSYYNPSTLINVYKVTTSAPTTTIVNSYVTASFDNDNSLYVIDSGNTVKLSATQSYWYNNGGFIQSASYQNMETPVFPVTLEIGDMLKLYNTSSGWVEEDEYRIVSAYNVVDSTGSFVYFDLDRPINPACLPGSNYPAHIFRYIINKHVPDETNVILRYSPKSNITQDGLLFSEYIDPIVKDQSGNIIKSLRSQNLLPPSV
jgi:hypothetical protein